MKPTVCVAPCVKLHIFVHYVVSSEVGRWKQRQWMFLSPCPPVPFCLSANSKLTLEQILTFERGFWGRSDRDAARGGRLADTNSYPIKAEYCSSTSSCQTAWEQGWVLDRTRHESQPVYSRYTGGEFRTLPSFTSTHFQSRQTWSFNEEHSW